MFRCLTYGCGWIAAGLLLGSCAHVGDRWLVGSPGFAANDQIMLVRKSPPSFGYHRLLEQSVLHPDLGTFVKLKGQPDFLAETNTAGRHYFILYYLKGRHAYACRTPSLYSREVEFTGPYPITPREYRLLDGVRQSAARRLAAPSREGS